MSSKQELDHAAEIASEEVRRAHPDIEAAWARWDAAVKTHRLDLEVVSRQPDSSEWPDDVRRAWGDLKALEDLARERVRELLTTPLRRSGKVEEV